MAITHVASSSSSTATCAVPTGSGIGDFAVLHVATFSSAPTAPSGWSLAVGPLSGAGSNAERMSIFFRNLADTNAVTVTGVQASYTGMTISTWRGINLGIHQVDAAVSSANGTAILLGSITTTLTSKILGFAGLMNSASSVPIFTTPSGWVVGQSPASTSFHRAASYYITSTTATQAPQTRTATVTSNSAGAWCGALVAIAELPATAGRTHRMML